MRLFALAVAFAATAIPASTQTTTTGGFTEITADVSEAAAGGEFILKGNARMRDRDTLLTADEIHGNHRSGEATAVGNVVFTRRSVRLLADKLVYHRNDESFSAENVRLGSFPYYAEGRSAAGNAQEITLTDAIVAYGEPGRWQPTLRADRVTYSEGSQISSDNARVGVGGAQFLPFPKFRQNLTTPFAAFVTANGGYRSSLGVFAEAGLHVPVALGVRVGGELSGYTQRGVMFGPGARYESGDRGQRYRGYFNSGYINDHGERGIDLLGQPVPENRAYAEWQHQQQLTERLDFKAHLNWWKDSEVLRDFRPRRFFPVQQPDTFLESTYSGTNYFVSLFGRFRPNSFQRVQERLPELRFDLLPTALPGGIYQRGHASVARLRERHLPPPPLAAIPSPAGGRGLNFIPFGPDPFANTPASLIDLIGGPAAAQPWTAATPVVFLPTAELESDRVDAYYALERPIASNEWLTITPMAGGRFTRYATAHGALRDRNYTRVLGELGVDAALRLSGTFEYRNPRWKIDGLRHLLTPRISYRYIPQADKGAAHIPLIDRPVFSTYLQPLGLGDIRHVDLLRPTNTLRVSLDNVLQTRDAENGTRDLAALNLAADFRFKRTRAERDVSEVHTEFALMPTHWLQLDVYNSFRPQDFTLREFNTGLTLRDADLWSVRFSNNFLRGQLEDYFVDGRVRFNEAFALLTRLHYDARKNRFNEQAYGLVQNLGNTWQVSYIVSLYSGRRRESRFGFNIEIDALRF